MANDYAFVQDLIDHLPDVTWDTDYEMLANRLITAASRAIDNQLKREAGAFYVSADTTRYFYGSGDDKLWIGELCAAPTSVSVAETGVLTSYTAWAATDYFPWPYNALTEGYPYYRLDIDTINGTKSVWYEYPKGVKIIGKFGFSTAVPDEILQATIIQSMRWFKRGQQAFQDTGAILELGQLRYTQQLDPDIKQILSGAKFQRLTI